MSPNCKVAEPLPSLPRTSLVPLLEPVAALIASPTTILPVLTTRSPLLSSLIDKVLPTSIVALPPISRTPSPAESTKVTLWVLRVPPFELLKVILFAVTAEPEIKSPTLSSASMLVIKVSTVPLSIMMPAPLLVAPQALSLLIKLARFSPYRRTKLRNVHATPTFID